MAASRPEPLWTRAGLRALSTAGERERDHARAPGPDDDRVHGEVLLRVPEGAVVGRVHGQVAVVAPAPLDLRLRAGAGERDLLDLGHLAKRVACGPAGVADRRVVVGPGRAVAEGDVAVLVLGDAAHPAPERIGRRVVGRVRPLLVDPWGAAPRAPHLVPADPDLALGRLH